MPQWGNLSVRGFVGDLVLESMYIHHGPPYSEDNLNPAIRRS